MTAELGGIALPPDTSGFIEFGEPLLFQAVRWVQWGTLLEGYSIILHPMACVAWFGLPATALMSGRSRSWSFQKPHRE